MRLEKRAEILDEVGQSLAYASEAVGTEYGFETLDDLTQVKVTEYNDDGTTKNEYILELRLKEN